MLAETLRDPVVLAAPFFVLFIVLEAVSFHVFSDDDLRGYDRRDALTSVTMGLGSLVFTASPGAWPSSATRRSTS